MIRKRLAQIFFLFFVGMFGISVAHAENFFLTGKDLYVKCNSVDATDVSSCKMYLVGVLDGRITYMAERADINGERLPIGICIYGKKDRTVDELRQAVIVQIGNNHNRYDDTYGGLAVVETIKKVFPCAAADMGPTFIKK